MTSRRALKGFDGHCSGWAQLGGEEGLGYMVEGNPAGSGTKNRM